MLIAGLFGIWFGSFLFGYFHTGKKTIGLTKIHSPFYDVFTEQHGLFGDITLQKNTADNGAMNTDPITGLAG